jgi:hypothetical protein
MCAAISAVMLQEEFKHIHNTAESGTSNRFYESWVNRIDIRELLKADDLKKSPNVISLLDSSILNQIASYALTPTNPLKSPKPYVSPNLTLFLSLTNLRGEPYSLNGSAPGSIEESTFFFGDRIRFETLRPDKHTKPAASAHPIDITKPGAAGGWDILQTAALATGAFPLFLAPRILSRTAGEYTPPVWESVVSATTGTPPPIKPNFPADLPQPFETLNVDGGVTNNDPFNYAHDYLGSVDPPCGPDQMFRSPLEVDRAVIGIAPFPTTEKFDINFDAAESSLVFSVIPRLISALISQSRFFGESLSQIMDGTTFSRFIIAPSDDKPAPAYPDNARSHPLPALQCAALGAFGGFFERGFRAHDYALGRRNCQKFLRDYFVLPADNVIIAPALKALDPLTRDTVLKNFRHAAPGTYSHSAQDLAENGCPVPQVQADAGNVWIPIIPLCGSVSKDLEPVPRATISDSAVDDIVKLILQRFRAVVSALLSQVSSWPLRTFLKVGQPVIRFLAKKPLKNALVKQLGPAYRARKE